MTRLGRTFGMIATVIATRLFDALNFRRDYLVSEYQGDPKTKEMVSRSASAASLALNAVDWVLMSCEALRVLNSFEVSRIPC